MRKLMFVIVSFLLFFGIVSANGIDEVHINPVSVGCGEQVVTISGTAIYDSGTRSLIVGFDSSILINTKDKSFSWSATTSAKIGNHEVRARIYGHSGIVKSSDILNFTISECLPIPPPPPPPPPIEPPVLEEPKPTEGILLCLVNGTCPCVGLFNNFYNSCVIQKYPNGKWCELMPTKTCFGLWKNCVPEPLRCKL